ncbi:MAG: ATP-dependent Clp protease ATP-binding subunit ClpX, partial [Myxococcales bacterium]|nr:ATP-dependent Clp protease ATP-binding subunit ClpX [Myxococcales bacterium]
IGFSAAVPGETHRQQELSEILVQTTPEDILEFGLIPELVGRLPVLTPLMPLTSDAMMQILTEPKNALVKQYQKLLELEGVMLRFTDGALDAVAELALSRKSGARGLRSILESTMLDIMYEVPSRSDVLEVIINEDVIRNEAEPMTVYDRAESA